MKRQLPDVNVLLALVWQRHESHRAAHAWFAKSGHRAWATNPLTELGVLRLLTNPAVTRGLVRADAAIAVLEEATRHEAHEFWPLDERMIPGLRGLAGRLRGHRQWTDAALLSHAAERDGAVVTFDSGLRELARGELRERVVLLKSG